MIRSTWSRPDIRNIASSWSWTALAGITVPRLRHRPIRVLSLLPYAPELNPVEHIWGELREKYLHNKAFNVIEALEDQLPIGFVALGLHRCRVKSIVPWDWINPRLSQKWNQAQSMSKSSQGRWATSADASLGCPIFCLLAPNAICCAGLTWAGNLVTAPGFQFPPSTTTPRSRARVFSAICSTLSARNVAAEMFGVTVIFGCCQDACPAGRMEKCSVDCFPANHEYMPCYPVMNFRTTSMRGTPLGHHPSRKMP